MSQAIHQAQAVKRILGDESMPAGERSQRAIQAFREIDVEKLEDQWSVDIERVWSAIQEAKQLFSQAEAMLKKGRIDESQTLLDSPDSLAPRLIELLDSAASRVIEAELDRILPELDIAFELPEGAILEAREHRDVIVPRLIATLKNAIAGARRGEVPAGATHLLAVYLLTEFQVEEAFPVLAGAIPPRSTRWKS